MLNTDDSTKSAPSPTMYSVGIGGEARTYIPLGSLAGGNGLDGMIFSLALKLSYK